jgi:glycosyltransferase involved in cell wall biosynthesis
VKRAVVTLAHPEHVGMLRALAVLEGASARHGWQLSYALAAPTALAAATGLPPARTDVVPGLRRWRRFAGRVGLPLTVARLLRLVRGADLLYSCTLSSFPYCLFAGRLSGRPQVVHVYSSYGDGASYRKHLLAHARHVVAPSADSLELARAAIGGFAPGVQAAVAYNGMDVARIVAEAAGPTPVPLPTGPRIGMVGNLDRRKNPLVLVEAAAVLRARMPGVRVLLVGAFPEPGYEREVRSRIDALGLGDAVTVTGFLANPFPVVRALDVLVHPARRDPFPLALLEGMALARPIVASAVGGIPEMLEHDASGLLVASPDDAAGFAAAVGDLLLDDAQRARLGAAAKARLQDRFSLDGFAATMFGLFDAAVADGTR